MKTKITKEIQKTEAWISELKKDLVQTTQAFINDEISEFLITELIEEIMENRVKLQRLQRKLKKLNS